MEVKINIESKHILIGNVSLRNSSSNIFEDINSNDNNIIVNNLIFNFRMVFQRGSEKLKYIEEYINDEGLSDNAIVCKVKEKCNNILLEHLTPYQIQTLHDLNMETVRNDSYNKGYVRGMQDKINEIKGALQLK